MRRSPENIATFEQNIFFHIFILFRTGSTDGCRYLVSERSTKEKTPKEQSRAKEINEKKANKKPTFTQDVNKGSASERSAKSGKVKSATRRQRKRSTKEKTPKEQSRVKEINEKKANKKEDDLLFFFQRKDDLPQISALTIRPCFDAVVPRLNTRPLGNCPWEYLASVLNDRQVIASETAERSMQQSSMNGGTISRGEPKQWKAEPKQRNDELKQWNDEIKQWNDELERMDEPIQWKAQPKLWNDEPEQWKAVCKPKMKEVDNDKNVSDMHHKSSKSPNILRKTFKDFKQFMLSTILRRKVKNK